MPALGAFLLAIAYLPGIVSPSVVPKLAILSLLTPGLLILYCRPPRLTVSTLLLVVLLALATLSIAWAISTTEAINGLWLLMLFAMSVALGAHLRGDTIGDIFMGFTVGLLVSLAIVATQWLDPAAFPWAIHTTPEPAGLFANGRLLGEIMALAALWCISAPVRSCKGVLTGMAAMLVVGMLLVGGRTALLSFIVPAFFVAHRDRRSLVLWVFAVCLSLLWYLQVNTRHSLSGRWEIWSDTISGITAFGHGIGNFFVAFPFYANAWLPHMMDNRPDHAHNEYLQFAFELGAVGGPLFAGLIGYALVKGYRSNAPLFPVALGVAIQALFSFPFHLPAPLFIGGIALGSCLVGERTLRAVLRDNLGGGPADGEPCDTLRAATFGGVVS